jgi:hypothetical protein
VLDANDLMGSFLEIKKILIYHKAMKTSVILRDIATQAYLVRAACE